MANMKMPMKFSAFLHYLKTLHKRILHWILSRFFRFQIFLVLEIEFIERRKNGSINLCLYWTGPLFIKL